MPSFAPWAGFHNAPATHCIATKRNWPRPSPRPGRCCRDSPDSSHCRQSARCRRARPKPSFQSARSRPTASWLRIAQTHSAPRRSGRRRNRAVHVPPGSAGTASSAPLRKMYPADNRLPPTPARMTGSPVPSLLCNFRKWQQANRQNVLPSLGAPRRFSHIPS